MKKDRFNLENLPLSFLSDFHDIEHDEAKQAVLDIVNLMYDDYDITEVQAMFSSFTTFAYEIYSMYLYRNDYDDDDYKQNLDMIVEVILFCTSQLEEYKVRPYKRCSRR